MINSFTSVKQLKSTYNYPNKQDFDDDDDVITSASGLRNMINSNKNVVNASTHTDSDYDKKYFRSLESNNNDDELDANAFENDSLSNTVIFVKNGTANKHQQNKDNQNNDLKGSLPKNKNINLDTRVHSITNATEKQSNEEINIGDEVKHLISKIITSIKVADNFSDDDDEDDNENESFEERRKKNSRYTANPKTS